MSCLEKRIDEYWNVGSSRHLSDSWKRFTKVTLLKEKPPKGQMWSGERLTKIPTTTRPHHIWPKVLTKIGKAAQNREKQGMVNSSDLPHCCPSFPLLLGCSF